MGSVASRPGPRAGGTERSTDGAGGFGTERSSSTPIETARPRARNAGSVDAGRFDDDERWWDAALPGGGGEAFVALGWLVAPACARGDGIDGGDANDAGDRRGGRA
jgi:hypothetical protein